MNPIVAIPVAIAVALVGYGLIKTIANRFGAFAALIAIAAIAILAILIVQSR